MKIYTKTGDAGETSLFGGGRVSKNTARIEAYGTVDELNSLLGFVRSLGVSDQSNQILETIQNDLFILGSDLATPPSAKANIKRMGSELINPIETWIDKMEEKLAPLSYFILPGGTKSASALHMARTVCRRAERCIITARETDDISNECVIYLNRLSDMLFVMARYENSLSGEQESKWQVR